VNANERSTIIVRQAIGSDAPELARLRWEHCFELADGYDHADAALDLTDFRTAFDGFLRDALETSRWFVWIAETSGEVVGTAWLQTVAAAPTPWRTERRWGYVTSVQVDRSWRGRGVGRALIEAVSGWARAEGLEALHLWHSDDSAAFYRRMGFVRSPDAVEMAFEVNAPADL
jgi:GNAT superfamily N-acetyltransferase